MRKLHIRVKETVFSVPRIFVDKYMPEADEKSVKVYLYLLCHLNDGDVSVETISEHLGFSEKEISGALKYWNDKGILKFSEGAAWGTVEFVPADDIADISVALPDGTQRPEASVSLDAPPKYLVKDINSVLKNDKDVRDMFLLAEQLVGNSLTHNDMKILYSFHDWLKFPTDVILLLLEHCTSIKKSDFRYIEKVALTWADNGIDTFEKANVYIKSQSKLVRMQKKIKRIVQITDRELTEKETEFVRSWIEDCKYTESNIKEAYEITVMNTGKMNFKYMDAVLKNLGKDVKDAPVKGKRKTGFDNYTGDEKISEFEKKMIARRMKTANQ